MNFFSTKPTDDANFRTLLPSWEKSEEQIDQRLTSFNSRYTFSAKEKDIETGYSYFGARYYNSDLSIWLSVDPMSDKSPSLSPYVYCSNNPVILVDPDGKKPVDPPWKTIPSVIPKSQFVGWTAGANCYKKAVEQIATVGYKPGGKIYQTYTEQKGVKKQEAAKAVNYIHKSLEAGKPVIVGVDNQDGAPSGNSDNSTDHFVVIVGQGTDKKGNYFTFYDNASSNLRAGEGTNSENKLYYDSNDGKISGKSQTLYATKRRDYIVTSVKETVKQEPQ